MVSSKGERLRGKLNLVEMLGALKGRSQWMYDGLLFHNQIEEELPTIRPGECSTHVLRTEINPIPSDQE